MNLELGDKVPQSAREFRVPRKLTTPERRSELVNLQGELGELNDELKRLKLAGMGETPEAAQLREQITLTTEALAGQEIAVPIGRPSGIGEPSGKSYAEITRSKQQDSEHLLRLRQAILETETPTSGITEKSSSTEEILVHEPDVVEGQRMVRVVDGEIVPVALAPLSQDQKLTQQRLRESSRPIAA